MATKPTSTQVVNRSSLAGGTVTDALNGLAAAGAVGPAGGVLAGSYPNPSFAVPMATVTALEDSLTGKQDTLVSGVSIKTVNGATLLGAGNLVVSGGGGGGLDPADRIKLDGIEDGATANSTDAALRARSSHTGTQTAATISDLSDAVRGITAAQLVPGTGITITNVGGVLTLSATGGSSVGIVGLSVLLDSSSTQWVCPVTGMYTVAAVGAGGPGVSSTGVTSRRAGSSGAVAIWRGVITAGDVVQVVCHAGLVTSSALPQLAGGTTTATCASLFSLSAQGGQPITTTLGGLGQATGGQVNIPSYQASSGAFPYTVPAMGMAVNIHGTLVPLSTETPTNADRFPSGVVDRGHPYLTATTRLLVPAGLGGGLDRNGVDGGPFCGATGTTPAGLGGGGAGGAAGGGGKAGGGCVIIESM